MSPGKQKSDSPVQSLEMQRLNLMDSLNRLKRSLEKKRLSIDTLQVRSRQKLSDRYTQQVLNIQDELDKISPNPENREQVEELCVTVESLLLGLLSKTNPQSESPVTKSHIKLPAQKLPKFSGVHSEFSNFIGLFESLVHNNASLSNVEKFNHLLSCLSDDALGTIKSFQVTSDNYDKALNSLKEIYDNKCLIFFNTISKLFDLPTSCNSPASLLRGITDTTSAIYDSLLSVGDNKQILNGMLIHLVMSKVDAGTRSKWEEVLNYNELPSWDSCHKFLNKRFQALTAEEAASHSHPTVKRQVATNSFNNRSNSKKSFVATKPSVNSDCSYCHAADHLIHACNSFRNLEVGKRFIFVKGVPLCINCLRRGHSVSQCNSSKCKVCAGPHHTLLHRYTTSATTNAPSSSCGIKAQSSNVIPASCNVSASVNEVILATAVIQIRNQNGNFSLARALRDSGSQVNCMTQELAQTLRLKHQTKAIEIVGIGDAKSRTEYQVTTTVKSRITEFQFTADFLVMHSISTRTPNHTISCSDLILSHDMQLADPYFFKSQKLDVLLGAELFFDLLCDGIIKTSSRLPVLQNTHFGWIVSGKFTPKPQVSSMVCHVATCSDTEAEINATLKKFWELEEVPNHQPILTEEQILCEKHFVTTVSREPTGRCVVSLPFKQSPSALGTSYDTAKRRFLSLERRLLKDDTLRHLYMDFMTEYLSLGHMTEIPHEIPSTPHYFIPHQCVLRPDSLSTKLRVVFDASS